MHCADSTPVSGPGSVVHDSVWVPSKQATCEDTLNSRHLLLGMLAASAGKIRFDFCLLRQWILTLVACVCRLEELFGQLACLSLTFSTLSILTLVIIQLKRANANIAGPF